MIQTLDVLSLEKIEKGQLRDMEAALYVHFI